MSSQMIPEFFAGNRRHLHKSAIEAELIIVPANGQLQKNADEAFPFRQDSSFWYFCGLDVADALLVLDVKHGHDSLIMPYRDKHRDLWETVQGPDEIKKVSGIDSVYDYKAGLKYLKRRLSESSTVHTLLPPNRRFYTFYGIHPNPAKAKLLKTLRRLRPGIKIESVREQVKDLRIIKQSAELGAIRQAISITEEALREVAKQRLDIKYEYQARAILHQVFAGNNVEPSFASVIAAGKNAATVHYEHADKAWLDDELLLIDAGAMVGYYAADISRIYKPANGFSRRQQEVAEAVKRVKAYAESQIKPGTNHRVYEKDIERAMGDELVKLGLLRRPSHAGIRRYFPSLTSHHLGLDTHDIANYDEDFRPGMVLTVEPGIYIPEEGIGIRIEDDVLVTKNGHEVLSKGTPDIL